MSALPISGAQSCSDGLSLAGKPQMQRYPVIRWRQCKLCSLERTEKTAEKHAGEDYFEPVNKTTSLWFEPRAITINFPSGE